MDVTYTNKMYIDNIFNPTFIGIYLDWYKLYNKDVYTNEYNYFDVNLFRLSQVNKYMYYTSNFFVSIINYFSNKNNLITNLITFKERYIPYFHGDIQPFSVLYIPNTTKLRWQLYVREFYNSYLEYGKIFINLFDGNLDVFSSIPNVKISNRSIGKTGYIDGVKNSDISHSICKGVDSFNRKFIILRYKCDSVNYDEDYYYPEEESNVLEGNLLSTMVIFQKYPNIDCLRFGSRYYYALSGSIDADKCVWINNIINGKTVCDPTQVLSENENYINMENVNRANGWKIDI